MINKRGINKDRILKEKKKFCLSDGNARTRFGINYVA
jgi:hypothetical protein